MSRSIQRFVRRNRPVLLRRAAIESLEGRRLLTLLCSLNSGVLTVQESDNGLSNSTTLQVVNGSLQISEAGDVMNENQALYNNGWRVSNDFSSATGSETGISSIVVDTDDGQDTLNIPNINLPVLIQPRGAASESIDLGESNSAAGAQDITGAITFDGTHAHSASIYIEETLDPTDLDPTITSTSILNLAGAPINFTAPPKGNLTFAPLNIGVFGGTGRCGYVIDQDASSSADISYQIESRGPGTMGLENLNAGSQARIVADAGGSQRALLGSVGLISGIKGNVEVDANGGTASLSVDDFNDTTAHTFAVQSNGTGFTVNEDGVSVAQLDGQGINALTLETGLAANTVNLNLGAFSAGFTTTVQSGGTDTVNVKTLPTAGQLDLVGGAGVDNISIAAGSVDGSVSTSNSTGKEAVTIDGSAISSLMIISVSDTSVTGLGTGTYSLAGLGSLSVIGGTAFDNFTVTPSTTTPITVDGGPASGASTDRLAISTTGVSGTALSLQTSSMAESGSYMFSNRQPITFSRFATITPTIGDITGTVYNAQTADSVAGATVIVDENNNGVADTGEPMASTDSSGAFSFTGLPTGTFALLVQDSGYQNLGTSSVTIAAGVLAAPLGLPIVPVATAGGPDLVVSVSVVGAGKTGLTKPKLRVEVTNAGAAMTSAVPFKIILAASTDTAPDPADTILLSAYCAPVLLKSNQSKILNFTGSTGSSLAKGSYYILAAVDTANAVAESNESNNVAATAKTIALAPAAVDLTGKFAKLPGTAVKAKPLAVSFSLQNLGTVAAAGTVDFAIYASTDQTLDGSDVALGDNLPMGAHVAAGKSQTAKFKLSLGSLSAGSYYLIARVNSTSSIAESDTSNNTVFSATPIAVS